MLSPYSASSDDADMIDFVITVAPVIAVPTSAVVPVANAFEYVDTAESAV